MYQSLDDLNAACADLAPINPKTGERSPKSFEVGVFCGKYVTPVSEGYFEHLERIRGEGRKLKILDNARDAVMKGTADEEQIVMAANGVEVTKDGKVVPSSPSPAIRPLQTNGHNWSDHNNGDVRDRMDISLHNLNDERS